MKILFLALVLSAACSKDAADRGVGSECTQNSDCTESGQTCLTKFKGGYCGITPCTHDANCPAGSACIMHTDNINYCFLTCAAKTDCNVNRSSANEANCSSTATFVDGAAGRKACTPPS